MPNLQNKYVILLSFTLIFASTNLAASKFDARENLRKWGFAYCVAEYSAKEEAKFDASSAMEGYFQRGQHNSEIAYKNVKNHVNGIMKSDILVGKYNATRVVLSQCLEIYESARFKSKIAENDKYIE